MSKEERYFIVQRDDLEAYGNEEGMTEAEAIAELETLEPADLAYMVVIVGNIVQVKIATKVSLSDN